MTQKSKVAAVIFYFIVLYFNIYKIPLAIQCWDAMVSYLVFPWMALSSAEPSSSPYWWLVLHNFQALLHLDLTLLDLVVPNKSVSYWHGYSHWLFLFLVSINSWHLGQAPSLAATGINLTLLLVMTLTYDQMRLLRSWISVPIKYLDWSKYIYLLALTSAPLLEITLYCYKNFV